MNVTFRPLPMWPHPSTPAHRRRGRLTFRAGWPDTLDLLERELRHLSAEAVLLAAGFRERDLRLDGWPKADARDPEHPGVELSFDSPHGRLVYGTDVCERWEHNVRSIALGLEALRAVDRYGITRRGEQYAGWRELGAASVALGAPMSADAARALLISLAPGQPTLPAAYREAVKRAHPDHGGAPEVFHQVQRAREALGL